MRTFNIQLEIDINLSEDELWPDGDKPANPSVSDVAALIEKCGGLDIIYDWDLILYTPQPFTIRLVKA